MSFSDRVCRYPATRLNCDSQLTWVLVWQSEASGSAEMEGELLPGWWVWLVAVWELLPGWWVWLAAAWEPFPGLWVWLAAIWEDSWWLGSAQSEGAHGTFPD